MEVYGEHINPKGGKKRVTRKSREEETKRRLPPSEERMKNKNKDIPSGCGQETIFARVNTETTWRLCECVCMHYTPSFLTTVITQTRTGVRSGFRPRAVSEFLHYVRVLCKSLQPEEEM